MQNDDNLIAELELLGYQFGTAEFDTALRQKRIEKCRERIGLSSCRMCQRLPFCTTAIAHYQALRQAQTES